MLSLDELQRLFICSCQLWIVLVARVLVESLCPGCLLAGLPTAVKSVHMARFVAGCSVFSGGVAGATYAQAAAGSGSGQAALFDADESGEEGADWDA